MDIRGRWVILGFAHTAILALLLGACGAPRISQVQESVTVVASFYPLYEFAKQVGGDWVRVRTLVPSGAEPHDWEPSPLAMVDVSRARVFVYNGAGFEPWVEHLLKGAEAPGLVVVDTSQGIEPEVLLKTEEKDQARAPDPHFWLDPLLARNQVEQIKEGLIEADPERREAYEGNAQAYIRQLEILHEKYQEGLSSCQSRTIVVAHAAYGHLAARYNLEVIAIAGLSPEAQPSPNRLAEIVRLVREKGIRYIFFEALVSPRVVETIAREVGAETLVLNPIEGLTPDQEAAGESYMTLMEDNLANLMKALECR